MFWFLPQHLHTLIFDENVIFWKSKQPFSEIKLKPFKLLEIFWEKAISNPDLLFPPGLLSPCAFNLLVHTMDDAKNHKQMSSMTQTTKYIELITKYYKKLSSPGPLSALGGYQQPWTFLLSSGSDAWICLSDAWICLNWICLMPECFLFNMKQLVT